MMELPIGLLMALSENLDAMERFATLDDVQKSRVVAQARCARSRRAMHELVERIANGGF